MTREEAIARLKNHKIAHKMNEPRAIYISEALDMAIKALGQEPKWILTSKRLPNKGQWVLVTKEDYQKPVEIMCYLGVQIGRHDIGNGWDEYEYPSWTSGHGDIQGSHPKAWMPLPKPYEPQESEEDGR